MFMIYYKICNCFFFCFYYPCKIICLCCNGASCFSLQSLKSQGYVREQFAWRHFYWYLTNEGIEYLRNYLHLPAEIVPATLKRQTRQEAPRPRPKGNIYISDHQNLGINFENKFLWQI